ncbi:TIGR03086 family metal-binding protein [Nocardia callitridis]|uniref:TIGR03086 family metal-binding protein n=1 Tax=Nocardia callitridis TaxID=648753 RepID=A0ABP9JT22_9NOCA
MDYVIGQIDRALDVNSAVVAALDSGNLDAPTPRQDWDVRTELNHTIGTMHIFAAVLSGTYSGAERESDWLGGDPRGAYAAAAEIDRAAWHRPDVLDSVIRHPAGTLPAPRAALLHWAELTTHGVDIAIAIGRPDLADNALCAELLDTLQAEGGIDEFRGSGLFGAEVPAVPSDPGHRRLLAYVGRALLSSTT